MSVTLDENGAVMALEEMPDAVVPLVEPLRVRPVQLAHPECDVGARCLDDEW